MAVWKTLAEGKHSNNDEIYSDTEIKEILWEFKTEWFFMNECSFGSHINSFFQ